MWLCNYRNLNLALVIVKAFNVRQKFSGWRFANLLMVICYLLLLNFHFICKIEHYGFLLLAWMSYDGCINSSEMFTPLRAKMVLK